MHANHSTPMHTTKRRGHAYTHCKRTCTHRPNHTWSHSFFLHIFTMNFQLHHRTHMSVMNASVGYLNFICGPSQFQAGREAMLGYGICLRTTATVGRRLCESDSNIKDASKHRQTLCVAAAISRSSGTGKVCTRVHRQPHM